MPRPTNRLTALSVKKDLPTGLHADGGGLYLQVSREKTKAWIFRFTRAGVPRKMGLGPVSTQTGDKRITLADARQKAAEARSLLLDGIDPIEARKARRASVALEEAKATPFRTCAEQYIADNNVAWKNAKHADQWRSTLEAYAYPVMGVLSVSEIDTALVLKTLRPIWHEKPETANRVRGRIESILDWAKIQGYREGENPARWRGHLDNVLPAKSKVAKVKHHKAMPYVDIASFMARLRLKEEVSAKALEFTILTGARTGEVIGAQTAEVDLDQKIWTIPGIRMKAGKEHRVPLSDRAIEVIKSVPKHNHGLLFPSKSGRPLSNMAMLEMLRGMRAGEGFTVHGFRSSFMDWGHEVTSFPKEMLDIALAHTVADKVEAAYRRGDMFEKRRTLMAEWTTYCQASDRGNHG